MTGFFFGLFNFIASNRWAQIVLSLGAVLLVIKIKAEHDEARGRRQEKARSIKATRNTIRTIEREAHETVERIQEDQRTYTAPDNAGELPDALRTVIIK